ncbi:hypothetical protein [Candidatus Aalborgicola defluviihabitans]|uniref:GspE/PulE/PilB domain-containing protein n=1 Tax=Candidatus Aalborgicola defluviihabitans TaxID=3386187 RepID=UPI0039B901F6
MPDSALKTYQVGALLGQQLVDTAAVQPDLLKQALAEQDRRRQSRLDGHLGDIPATGPVELASQTDTLSPYSPVRLGDILMDQGLVSREQLLQALDHAKSKKSNMLGHILVEMGALTWSRLTQAVAEQLALPAVSLRDFTIALEVLALVPKAFAFSHRIALVPPPKTLVVAVESPVDADYLEELHLSTRLQITPVMANPEELSARIAVEYANIVAQHSPVSIEHEIAQLTQQTAPMPLTGVSDQQVSETDTVLVRLVNKMVEDAQGWRFRHPCRSVPR